MSIRYNWPDAIGAFLFSPAVRFFPADFSQLNPAFADAISSLVSLIAQIMVQAVATGWRQIFYASGSGRSVVMKVTIWLMLPGAIALHAVIFMLPLPAPSPVTKTPPAQNRPIKVVLLPLSPPTPPKSLPLAIKPVPKMVVPPLAARQTAMPPSPTPARSPQPEPPSEPALAPAQTPEKTPETVPQKPQPPADELPIAGAKPACDGLVGCWQVPETKGRLIASTVEEKLQAQGYILTSQDIPDDTGMLAYEVKKDGKFQYYLHLAWSERGTVYLQNPELLSLADVEAKSRS
jgi:hypothetical protein